MPMYPLTKAQSRLLHSLERKRSELEGLRLNVDGYYEAGFEAEYNRQHSRLVREIKGYVDRAIQLDLGDSVTVESARQYIIAVSLTS